MGITNTDPKYNGSQNKVVILTFDDGSKSQYINTKPILDNYGFKGTFFIVCNYANSPKNTYMNWQEVLRLQNDGMDVESHTMSHVGLDKLSLNALNFEIGQSKKCLLDHGINATILATPYNKGWNNATVIDTIAKYYVMARNGNASIMFLHCDGWKEYSNETDCRTHSKNGTLTYANRYSIRAWSHNFYDQIYLHNNTKIFEKFIKEVDQDKLNKDGTIIAIPILEYHYTDNNKTASSTNIDLFKSEMKYLHDNGFKVLTMANLAYNKDSNQLYVKGNNTKL